MSSDVTVEISTPVFVVNGDSVGLGAISVDIEILDVLLITMVVDTTVCLALVSVTDVDDGISGFACVCTVVVELFKRMSIVESASSAGWTVVGILLVIVVDETLEDVLTAMSLSVMVWFKDSGASVMLMFHEVVRNCWSVVVL